MDVNLNLALNNLSFGQISFALVKYFYEKKYNTKIIPIANNVDISSQSNVNKDFADWLRVSISSSLEEIRRDDTIFKLWHLNGSLESFCNKQVLLSFYELDTPTKTELNIVKNNHNVVFSSKYTCDIFKAYGCNNVKYIPLFFDENNFKITNKKYFQDDRITFNLVGKLEKRKNHKKTIQAWLKKFGNNPKYFLQCSVYNHFLKQEDQNTLINSILDGKRYFNISFLSFMQTNQVYNDYLNSADIILGMSGGEGWGLPEFHSLALGKHGVFLNAHSYKDWANNSNSVMVEPSEKIEVYDNMFFHKGSPYNQGNIFSFKEDDFINACEKAIDRVEKNRVNENGIALQKKYTLDETASNIIELLK